MERLIFGGLIYGGKFAFQSRLGKPYSLHLRAIFQVQAPGGLYLEGRFNGGFFALPVLGACIWRGLFSEFYFQYEINRAYALRRPGSDAELFMSRT